MARTAFFKDILKFCTTNNFFNYYYYFVLNNLAEIQTRFILMIISPFLLLLQTRQKCMLPAPPISVCRNRVERTKISFYIDQTQET